jgi:transcription elongation factor GreA
VPRREKSMKKLYRLTQAGVDELKEEHTSLIGERAGVAERIKDARELGDLSENAEYQSAREEQDRLEARISELEHILQNVQIIKIAKNNGKIRLGSEVELKSSTGKTEHFQIVGTMEADPLNGKISDESPIGQVLMGKEKGETVEVKLGNQTTSYKVVDIK